MKIFILGHRGYVGSYLADRLKKSHDIIGMDAVLNGDYRLVLPDTLRSFDAVILLAAHSSVKTAAADPYGAVRNNLFGPIELVEKLDGKPLLYASSSSVHATEARTVYDSTKRAADEMIPAIYPNSYGLRFGTVCGVAPIMREDTMLNSMTRAAVRENAIHVRNQHKWRPVLTLDDLGWFMKACLDGFIAPGLHDVATFNCRIGGYADMVSQVTGAEIISEPDTQTYNFKVPVLGRTDSIYPVIEELVAHWKPH